jgi:hypothetical protein
MAAPRMTTGDPAKAKPDTAGCTVSFDRLHHVGGAGRPIPAMRWASGGDRLIPADSHNQGACRPTHVRPPPVTVLTPSDTIFLKSPYDSVAAAGAAPIR